MKATFLVLFALTLFAPPHINAQVFFIDAETASYIDAAAYSPANSSILFFADNAVMIYDITTEKLIEPEWYQVGDMKTIDAAVSWSDDEVLLFHGPTYDIFNVSQAELSSRNQDWPGLPNSWNSELDAAVRWSEDEIMFFYNNEYVVYSFIAEDYMSYDYFSTWDGFPELWESGLEAVFNIQGQIYFLNDGDAAMFSMEEGTFYAPSPIGYTKTAE